MTPWEQGRYDRQFDEPAGPPIPQRCDTCGWKGASANKAAQHQIKNPGHKTVMVERAHEDIPYLLSQLALATQEIARLREYAQHKDACAKWFWATDIMPREPKLNSAYACTCGLTPEGER